VVVERWRLGRSGDAGRSREVGGRGFWVAAGAGAVGVKGGGVWSSGAAELDDAVTFTGRSATGVSVTKVKGEGGGGEEGGGDLEPLVRGEKGTGCTG